MAEPMPSNETERLAERLKLEARVTRPAFSEALHRRIRRALDEHEAPAPRPVPTAWWQPRWLPMAVAAAVLVSASAAVWWLDRPLAPGPTSPGGRMALLEPGVPVADPGMITEPAVRTAEQVSKLVDSTVADGQWAYLDHDARLAFQMLMDQLPLDVASIE